LMNWAEYRYVLDYWDYGRVTRERERERETERENGAMRSNGDAAALHAWRWKQTSLIQRGDVQTLA
jgi:hypothetical protein